MGKSFRLFISTFILECIFLPSQLLSNNEESKYDEEIKEITESAKYHFTKGVKHYEKQEWDLALEEFKNAFAMKPHWKIRYNIGLCYYKLELWAQAMTELTLMMEEGGNEINLAQAKKVKEVIKNLENKVSRLILEGNIEKTEIEVDGKPVWGITQGGIIFLNPGEHRFTIKYENEVVQEMDIVLMGGQSKTIYLDIDEKVEEIKAKKIKEKLKPPPLQPIPQARPTEKKKVPWHIISGSLLLSLGIGGIATGVTAGVFAINEKEKRDNIYNEYILNASNGNVTEQSWQQTTAKLDEYYNNAKKWAIISDVMIPIGSSLIIASVIAFVIPEIKKRHIKKTGLSPDRTFILPAKGSMQITILVF